MVSSVPFNNQEYLKKIRNMKPIKFRLLGEHLWCKETLNLEYKSSPKVSSMNLQTNIKKAYSEFSSRLNEKQDERNYQIFDD